MTRLRTLVLAVLPPALTALAVTAPPSGAAGPAEPGVRHHTTAQERQILRHDPTARLGDDGRLYFRDPAATVRRPTATPAAPYPYAQTFQLHSKPDSAHVIFLDFDGATVSSQAWDGEVAGTYPAWDPAGDGAAFAAGEQDQIQSIWQRVAEDYAPFDVDVTTQDPGATRLTQAYSTHALIGPNASAWQTLCQQQCGGLAYIGVFSESDRARYQPAWVFTGGLGPDDTKAVAEAVSHEVGHTMGLDHDGLGPNNSTTGYYDGSASNGWAPIMGAGYSEPVTQWSNGSYTNAGNHEDDVSIIAASTQGYRVDEAGSTIGTAAAAPAPGVSAYITTRTDTDVYALGTCAGAVSLAASPAPVSPDLDIGLTLLDSSGASVTSADPAFTPTGRDQASGLSASIAQTLASGTYYLKVDGVGAGSPSTSYDDYGSLGAYTLSASGCDGVTTPTATAPGAPTSVTAVPQPDGHSMVVSWAPPVSDGGAAITGYRVSGAPSGTAELGAGARSLLVTGLSAGTTYTFGVSATNARGTGPATAVSATTVTVPVVAVPDAPRIGTAKRGARGRPITATATWRAPTSNGGAAITGYQVMLYRLDGAGRVIATARSVVLSASTTSAAFRLKATRYRFAVRARNSAGWSALSTRSNIVTAR